MGVPVQKLPKLKALASERISFEGLISDLSARFMSLPPGKVDEEIEQALAQVRVFFQMDRWGLIELAPDGNAAYLSHIDYAEGVPHVPKTTDLRGPFPWCFREVFERGNSVVGNSIDDLPDEAEEDKQNVAAWGIKSWLNIPLFHGGRVAFMFVANSMRQERHWPEEFLPRLRLLGEIFVNAVVRTRAEEALRASEARLEAGADLAGIGYYEVDFSKGISYADNRMCLICGIPPGRNRDLDVLHFWLEHLHPDDRALVTERREQLHGGNIPRLSIEYRFLHPSDGVKWIHHRAHVAARDAAGRALRTYGVLRDITERRQAEESLRQSYAEIERLKERLQAEGEYLKAEMRLTRAHGEVIGQSAGIRNVLRMVEQVAPTDSSVLVRGETGTGKELVAQAIHRLSPRRNHLIVKVNCAALPSGLVESELFGREKGAYTGALTRQVGRFEIADDSTIFLDEIGELPLDLQAKLLRVLESGEFERLGSSKTIKVNVRLIAATNRDLAEAIRQGRFREDLYYRLNVFRILVPPLRDRAEDIPPMVWAFLKEFSTRMGKKITQVPRKTMDALRRHTWPGNVRELRNVIEHGAIITSGDTLRIPLLEDSATSVAGPRQTLADAEREHILRVLERAGWHIKGPNGAAKELGINPATLYSRMQKLGIQPHRQAEGGSL
jgi:formate hydrogenlyase transcriptional activator